MNWSLVLPSITGGLLIGLAVTLYLLGAGRIAGISGIFGNVLSGQPGRPQLAFLSGLLLAPWLALALGRDLIPDLPAPHWPKVLLAGLLVGVGTFIGSGCTSGHGVCGLANFSPRGLAATLTFMFTAALLVAFGVGGL